MMSYVSQLILVPFVPRFLIEVVTLLSVELVSTTDKLITKPTDHTRCEQWVQTSLHFCSRTEGDHMALGERDQAALGDGAHAALGQRLERETTQHVERETMQHLERETTRHLDK